MRGWCWGDGEKNQINLKSAIISPKKVSSFQNCLYNKPIPNALDQTISWQAYDNTINLSPQKYYLVGVSNQMQTSFHFYLFFRQSLYKLGQSQSTVHTKVKENK